MHADLTLLPVGGPAAGFTDALTSAAGYALSEKADATRRAYRADIGRFSTWCQEGGAIALPATPTTVAAYLAALADSGLKVSTISRRAAAIAYAHKLAGFEPPLVTPKPLLENRPQSHPPRPEALLRSKSLEGRSRARRRFGSPAHAPCFGPLFASATSAEKSPRM
jgi:Phage integrase, N-terminal SAM-like domain